MRIFVPLTHLKEFENLNIKDREEPPQEIFFDNKANLIRRQFRLSRDEVVLCYHDGSDIQGFFKDYKELT